MQTPNSDWYKVAPRITYSKFKFHGKSMRKAHINIKKNGWKHVLFRWWACKIGGNATKKATIYTELRGNKFHNRHPHKEYPWSFELKIQLKWSTFTNLFNDTTKLLCFLKDIIKVVLFVLLTLLALFDFFIISLERLRFVILS